jgi:hypothetical protein
LETGIAQERPKSVGMFGSLKGYLFQGKSHDEDQQEQEKPVEVEEKKSSSEGEGEGEDEDEVESLSNDSMDEGKEEMDLNYE